MRPNGKCNNSRPLAQALAVFCFTSDEPNITEGTEYEKISKLYRCTERSFTNSTKKQRQLLWPLNNLILQIKRESILMSDEPNITEGTEYEKISKLYRCTERSFTNSTKKQRQLLWPLNNLILQIKRESILLENSKLGF